MSIKLMSQAWELRLAPTDKLVLLALCDWANDAGYCFPSVATVARKTCISKRQCQRILKELVTEALVTVVGNHQGGAGSRRYKINLSPKQGGATGDGGDSLTPLTRAATTPVTPVSNTRDTHVARTVTNHQCEPLRSGGSLDALDWTRLPQLDQASRTLVAELLRSVDAAEHQSILDELAGAIRAGVIRGQWPSWFRGLVQRARVGEFAPNHASSVQRDRQRSAREADEARKRRAEAERRNDPVVRARSVAAMERLIAELAAPSGKNEAG